MDNFSITFDATQPIAMLMAAGHDLRPALLEELRATGEMVKTVMKRNAPRGVGAENNEGLANTIEVKMMPELLAAEVKPKAPYADAVENGSRPHWVSAKEGSPLELWAKLRGINVYAVQHSIAVKGTKPHPFIQPTYDEVLGVIDQRFALAIAKFIGTVSYAV